MDFNNINSDNIIDQITHNQMIPNVDLENKDAFKVLAKKREQDEKYKQEVLDALKQIESNTANLKEIVNLIQCSDDKQDEILNIITELLSIAKEKNQENVETKYRQIMGKINKFTGDVDTMIKLYGFGMAIYTILKTTCKQ